MRANCENSSTSVFSASTSPTIVPVHSSTSARTGAGEPANWRWSRWAHSWIGVRGFLISCARRRATSRQAATFWARMSGVMSSSTSTRPSSWRASPCRGVAAIASCTSRPSRVSTISCAGHSLPATYGAVASSASGFRSPCPNTSSAGRPAAPASRPSSRAAAGLRIPMRPPASMVMTPVATRSRTASVNRRRSSTSACLRWRSTLDCSRARRLAASSSAIVLNASTSEPNSSTVSRSRR